MNNREFLIPLFKEYKEKGGTISPMNTETCRRYLEERINSRVEPEDVLWLFYHVD